MQREDSALESLRERHCLGTGGELKRNDALHRHGSDAPASNVRVRSGTFHPVCSLGNFYIADRTVAYVSLSRDRKPAAPACAAM
jgi:hypothetical protein